MDKLVFSRSPAVTFATNVFVNVPTILQFDDTPLISIVQEENWDSQAKFPSITPMEHILQKCGGRGFLKLMAAKKQA